MESLIWQEKLPQASIDFNSQRRVMDQLAHGRDLAVRLQTIFRREPAQPRSHGSVTMARDIVEKILKSFSDSIYMLGAVESSDVSGSEDGGYEDSGANKKKLKSAGSKNGRGCYKRRKESRTWTEVSSTVEDSYAWRKYGQKEIINTKFPRCYYRCTHKLDQGCKATKQVQRMEECHRLYRITYIGEHTCKRTSNLSPQMITDADPWEPHDSAKPQKITAIVEKLGYFKLGNAQSDVTDKILLPVSSKLDAELELEPEPTVACDYDFSSPVDPDDFMASFLHLDAGDFALDQVGNALL
ncbi:hypothetical protein SAY87_007920 [Trapa incisa]|uniref:WRKY domain-containing protein n=1 Tax=Trapa incisa TaxID=236973 RepID=A0AAN7QG46_9MYRT|nr:hypothetical protein SAY87_007920 [Trapa incisa]